MFYVACILIIILYIYACLAMELITRSASRTESDAFDQIAADNFDGIFITMLTLLQFVTADSMAAVYIPLIRESPLTLLPYFASCILIVTITLQCLVTAVIVESAFALGAQDQEFARTQQVIALNKAMPQIRDVFLHLDSDGNRALTWEEFSRCDPKVKSIIEASVGEIQLLHLFDYLDTDGSGQVSLDEFCNGLIKLSVAKMPIELLQMQTMLNKFQRLNDVLHADLRTIINQLKTESEWRRRKRVEHPLGLRVESLLLPELRPRRIPL